MDKSNKRLTIAIDGHSSCGKSTVAKSLAKQLNYTYIDSGAMYRAVTLYCMRHDLIKDGEVNASELKSKFREIKIHFTFDENTQKYLTWLNNQLIEDEIRTIQVSDNVSIVSKIGFVREQLVAMQQEMGKQGGIVMDGRDIGTVVFPQADLKIFMTASVEVRANRRYKELLDNGDTVTYKEVADNIQKRDQLDENREISPLRKADDAITIDNSNLTREEQLEKILNLVNERI